MTEINLDKDMVAFRIRELLSRAFVHYCVCHILREDKQHGSSHYDRERSYFEDVVHFQMGVLSSTSRCGIPYDEEMSYMNFGSLIRLSVDRALRFMPSSGPNRTFRLQSLKDEDHENFVRCFYDSVGKESLLIWGDM